MPTTNTFKIRNKMPKIFASFIFIKTSTKLTIAHNQLALTKSLNTGIETDFCIAKKVATGAYINVMIEIMVKSFVDNPKKMLSGKTKTNPTIAVNPPMMASNHKIFFRKA